MRGIAKIFAKGLAASALLLVFHGCSANKTTDPIGKKDDPILPVDSKPTKGLLGVLVDQKGSPVKGAVVKAIPDTYEALAKRTTLAAITAADSAITDSVGAFLITGLAKGSYNLMGISGKGDLVILIKGIKYGGETTLLELQADTLRVPGKLSGRIVFGEGDSGGIVCTIPGTAFRTVTGDSGTFTLSGLPQGTYSITYRKDGLKAITDTAVIVKSGETAKPAMQIMEADPAFPPPAPLGFTIAYDTLTGKATLRWRKVKVDDLAGYVIYRDAPSSTAPTRLGTTLVKDTVYVDPVFASVTDVSDKAYAYRLKSQDTEANLSPDFSKAVELKATSPSKVRTAFTWKISGAKADSASIGDSVTVSAAWTNPSRRIVKLAFYLDAKTTAVRSKRDSALSGSDSLKVSSPAAAVRKVFAEATDDAGTAWWDSLTVRFVLDVPRVDAGLDTSVAVHTLVKFSATATQSFGTIAKYLWDFDGDGVLDDSSATGTTTHVYEHSKAYFAKLVARDDDGNEGVDYRTVEVTNQPPKVKTVRADTTVSINDPITFTGTGSDTDGTLKGYGWDFDGNGTLDTSAATPFAPIHGYPTVGAFNAVFRLTDDDGLIAERTVKITVAKDAPVANAGKDTTVSIKDVVRLTARGTDKYGSIVAWAWNIGGAGTFKQVSKSDTTTNAPAIATGAWPCILRVTDDDGNFGFDTLIVTVVKDAPTANAGNDTTVSIGDAIYLSGKGTDGYGTIVERAWDIGATGTFRITATGDTTVFAPLVPSTFVCSLKVTDDDGNIVKDVMIVTVVKDAPIAFAGRDTTVAVGQALTLTGTANQNFGTIAMYKWDWQDNGSWDDSSSTIATTIFAVPQGGTRTVLFAVRDDDGNVAVDTVLVQAVSYVGGTLSGNTVFYKSLSPYVLTSDLVLPTGANLTISAGVNLSGPYTVLVKGGTLLAVGIAADSVKIASPVRFEGTNLSSSNIGYARMSAAVALQIGNNSLGAGAAQNIGTLLLEDVGFPKNKLVIEAMSSPAKLVLRRVTVDSSTLIGNGGGVNIELHSSSFVNAIVQSGPSDQNILFDSSTALNTTFRLGDGTDSLTVKNCTFTSSNFGEVGGPSPLGSGQAPVGPLSFDSSSMSNTTINLPKSEVKFSNTTATFSGVDPLLKIGHGALAKSTFTGQGTGTGLEITGYHGNSISGATTLNYTTQKDFNIGVLIRGFSSLSIYKNNFVNNLFYDLANYSAQDFNALNCYWSGALSDVNINTRIRDNSDDPALGKVTYNPADSTLITN